MGIDTETRRLVKVLDGAFLPSEYFELPKRVIKEIKRRDRIEHESPSPEIYCKYNSGIC